MIGLLAPAAKVEPVMPGFVISVSVMVAPGRASISREVATVTDAKASVSTINVPGGRSNAAAGTVAGEVGCAAGAGADVAGAGAGLGLATGLGVVTTTGGSCVWAAASPAGASKDAANAAAAEPDFFMSSPSCM